MKNRICHFHVIFFTLQSSLICLVLSIGSMPERLVLKNFVECTRQRLKWTSGARVMIIFGRAIARVDRSGRWLGRSVARLVAWSLARPLDRSLDRSLGRSVARSLGRSLARSVARSIGRSLDRSLARSLGRSLGLLARSLAITC